MLREIRNDVTTSSRVAAPPPIMQAVRIRRSKRIRMPTDCTLDVNRLIKLASQQTETLKLPQPAKPAKIHAKAFSS